VEGTVSVLEVRASARAALIRRAAARRAGGLV